MSSDSEALRAAYATGTEVAVVAAKWPDRVALTLATPDPGLAPTLTFSQLEANINRLVGAFRAGGLEPGDGVALLCSNRPEWIEVFWATQRSGLRLIPVNWHLEASDVAYVVSDSGARGLVAEAKFAQLAGAAATTDFRLCVGGDISGFEAYEAALAEQPPDLITDPSLGTMMIYTSGTTGRPKGVRHPDPDGAARAGAASITGLFDFRPGEGDVMLCTAPLYHSGPSRICNEWPLGAGIGVVLMNRFDAAQTLELIERHRVTHAFMVPTMFHRLLALPREVRNRHDLSTLRFVLHGAAPTTVESKRAMIEWLGPIVHEMFAATEGFGTWITPTEWLDHPGSVGLANPDAILILDDVGAPVGPDVDGTIYFRSRGAEGFRYHEDSTRTAGAHDGTGEWFTVGDMGRVDASGYLYLTGRDADVIITGGVNLYPARIDEALLDHPAVVDACSFGIPDDDYGEIVMAHVIVADGIEPGHDLEAELLEHCRATIGTQMSPRSVVFVDSLPRTEAGKLYRQRVRAPYWDDSRSEDGTK